MKYLDKLSCHTFQKSQYLVKQKNGYGSDVRVNEEGSVAVQLAYSPVFDSFGRLRVSDPQFAFDAQFTYDLQPLVYEQITSNGGAIVHDTTNRCALMSFTNDTNPSAYMQSYEWIRYQPGRSQTYFITFNFVEPASNVTKFAGVGDGNNGIELQQIGPITQVKLYSNTELGDQTVLQSDWNIDTLDGSKTAKNPSGITLDLTKTQILVISYQALYVGRVILALDINGQITPIHAFDHANFVSYPYIQNASLPVRCGMTGTGTVTTTMEFICSSAISEGGQPEIGGYSFSVEGSANAANGVSTHILSLRPTQFMPAGGAIVNRSKFVLDSAELVVTGNFPVKFDLVLGQALTGNTAFIDENTAYSGYAYNSLGTLSGSPAIVMGTWYVASAANTKGQFSSRIASKYPITLDAAGNTRSLGTLTMIGTGIGGASACRTVFNWREIR